MGFRVDTFANIKEVDTSGQITKCKLIITKKHPMGKHVCTFSAWVAFFGDAALCKPLPGQRIKILSCDVSNGYLSADGEQHWTKSPQYAVYSYELQQDLKGANGFADFGSSSHPVSFEELANGDDLPF